ncbi:MAG: hypothetical protein WD711_04665 [Dongiaceae bacterium]
MMPGYQMLAALAVIFAAYAVQEIVFTEDGDAPRIDRPAPAANGAAPAPDRAAPAPDRATMDQAEDQAEDQVGDQAGEQAGEQAGRKPSPAAMSVPAAAKEFEI